MKNSAINRKFINNRFVVISFLFYIFRYLEEVGLDQMAENGIGTLYVAAIIVLILFDIITGQFFHNPHVGVVKVSLAGVDWRLINIKYLMLLEL